MKQFAQIINPLRSRIAQILTAALLAVTATSFPTTVQADPGQGAVVMHMDRNRDGSYSAESPDGQLRLDVSLTGLGNLLRRNPDGTYTMQIAEPRAPMSLSVRGDEGEWVPVWIGEGSFHITGTVQVYPDGYFDFVGDSALHVQGRLTNVVDDSIWSFHVVAVMRGLEFKTLKIDLVPR